MSNTIINNAGKYNRQITIYQETITKDPDGFPVKTKSVILQPYASVKTTRGFTLIQNDSNFEKAFTNFTIRYPITQITCFFNDTATAEIYTMYDTLYLHDALPILTLLGISSINPLK